MQKFRLWWTFHSNAIEGNSLTQGETEMFLMEGLTAKGKPLKDHLDLRGHSNAINYLLGFIRDKEVLTEAAIRHLHETLLVEPYQVQAITPDGLPTMKTVALGQHKTQPNHVRTPTGETHYYATPEDTPAKMQDLMNWYREESAKGSMHPVEVSARFHHRFTEIHPFDDGNGRMSRLLMNLMLMQCGFPPAIIRNTERNQYLAALRRADASEYDDFIVFIGEHVLASLDVFIRAARAEEIQEPTDIEKEIALLKMELKHIEEPEPISPAALERLLKGSFEPLMSEVVRLLAPLCELFAESAVQCGSYSVRMLDETQMLPWDRLGSPMNISFVLRGFKKAKFDTFDLSGLLAIHLEPLKYRIVLHVSRPELVVQHFYQEQLTEDEIVQFAQALARFFLDAIKKKTNGKSVHT